MAEILGYDTLSFGEGRGEATDWQSDFSRQLPSIQYLSMAEGRGEVTNWLSQFA